MSGLIGNFEGRFSQYAAISVFLTGAVNQFADSHATHEYSIKKHMRSCL